MKAVINKAVTKRVSGFVVCLATSIAVSNIAVSNAALAGEVELSGFADIIYTLSDGVNDNALSVSNENKFDVSAEVDLKTAINEAMSVRIDVDLNAQSDRSGGADSSRIEQAFFSWTSPANIGVKGGIFNNPLGWEAEDAPDLYQISHGQLYNIWDSATDFSGNNVAGVEVSAMIGPVQVAGAILNDLGNAANEPDPSLMGYASYSPKRESRLMVEAGFVTQDAGLKTIVDLNATFTMPMLIAGVEVLLPSEEIDFAVGATGSYSITDQFSVTVRADHVRYDLSNNPAIDDVISITLAASYKLDKNLVANMELRINDGDFETLNADPSGGCDVVTCDGEIIQVEILALF